MGSIISSKVRDDGKVIFEVVMDYDEAIQLQGHMDNVYLFTEKTAAETAGISQRGKNEATKYFLIPRELRKDLKFNNDVFCQRVDTKTKIVFIYLVDKYGIKHTKNKDRN